MYIHKYHYLLKSCVHLLLLVLLLLVVVVVLLLFHRHGTGLLHHAGLHLTGTSATKRRTASLRTKIRDFRGFDSSVILMLRGELFMSIGNSQKCRVDEA